MMTNQSAEFSGTQHERIQKLDQTQSLTHAALDEVQLLNNDVSDESSNKNVNFYPKLIVTI